MKHWCFGSQRMQERTLSSFPMLGSSWKSNLWEWGSSITSGCSYHWGQGCIGGFRKGGCCWFPSWYLWQSRRPSILRDSVSQSSMMCSVIRWADGLASWWHTSKWCGIARRLVVLNATPTYENFLCILQFWPVEALPTVAAIRLILVFDDHLAPRANWETVPVSIDSNCVHSSGQSVCRGEQQIKDDVGKRWLCWMVHPFLVVKIRIIFLWISIDFMKVSTYFRGNSFKDCRFLELCFHCNHLCI